MADAFKNYDALTSALNAQRNQSQNQNITIAQTKAGIDSTTKILGETKLFLSGKPALQKLSKNFLKPALDKYKGSAKEWLQNKVDTLKNKITDKVTKPEGEQNSTTDIDPIKPDDIETPEALQTRLRGEQGRTGASPADEDKLAEEFGDRANKLEQFHTMGDERVFKLHQRIKSGDAEPNELTPQARAGATQAEADGAENVPRDLEGWRAKAQGGDSDLRNNGGWEQPKTKFTDNDIGETPGPETGAQTYDRQTGLSEAEQTEVDGLNKMQEVSRLPPPNEGALSSSRAGTLKTTADEPPSYDDALKMPGKPKAKGKEEEDIGEDEELGELGGEEAATGILDLIPGLDILGAVGGAVIAGIEAHKQNQQVKAESAIAPLKVNVDTQAGSGGSEALS